MEKDIRGNFLLAVGNFGVVNFLTSTQRSSGLSDITRNTLANWIIRLSLYMYRLERQCKELDDDERYEKRQQIAIPKLAMLKRWLDEKQPKVAPDTLTRKAINYMINQWDHLVRYCELGQLCISNTLAENAIRPFAVGRRAWLFSDSPDGARASAAMFTLIETAKANGVEPYAYLQHVYGNIAAADTDEALDARSCRGICPEGRLKRQIP